MHGPPAVTAALVTGSIVVALYCAASLAVRGRSLARGPLAEVNHVVMSLAMAVMLVPATMDLVAPAVGLAAFAALALAWVAGGLARRGRGSGSCASPWHLMLVNAAMATMYAAMMPTTSTGPIAATGAMPGMPGMEMPGMPGMAAGSAPSTVVVVASLALGIVLLVHAARSVGGALVGGGAAVAGAGLVHRVAESPRAHLGCQALMSAVMGVALFLSL